MSARQIDRVEWAAFFDTFSRHYRGRPVDVQILGENLGLYALAQGQSLVGITAQLNNPPHDVEIIAGDALAHISHSIREPTEVWVDQGKSGRDSSLKIASKDGTMVLLQLGIAESHDTVLRLLLPSSLPPASLYLPTHTPPTRKLLRPPSTPPGI
jgi:hypothetical protein